QNRFAITADVCCRGGYSLKRISHDSLLPSDGDRQDRTRRNNSVRYYGTIPFLVRPGDSHMKIVITSLMFSLTVAVYSSQVLAAADEQQQAAAKITFLVIYRPGPAWLVGKSVSEQPLKEHGK